jgi:mRNA-degrading endonuclease RelE of RelBE toxin-antitoxin system
MTPRAHRSLQVVPQIYHEKTFKLLRALAEKRPHDQKKIHGHFWRSRSHPIRVVWSYSTTGQIIVVKIALRSEIEREYENPVDPDVTKT